MTEFEEARRYERELFMNTTESKPRPKIVEVRRKNVSINREMSYKDILRDLYVGYLEDQKVNKIGYWNQVKIFDKWYEEIGLETAKKLVKELVLVTPSSSAAEKERTEKVRDTYFYVPQHNFKKLW